MFIESYTSAAGFSGGCRVECGLSEPGEVTAGGKSGTTHDNPQNFWLHPGTAENLLPSACIVVILMLPILGKRRAMSELTKTREPVVDSPTVSASCAAAVDHLGDAFTPPPGYELLSLIARGGMGAVYRARNLELARDVAVKILLPQFAPGSTTARRFVDEAHITGRLQHPGIPAIYHMGTLANGRPFLAMKLIDGRTLEEMLQERTASAAASDRAVSVIEQIMHEPLDRLEEVLQRGRFLAIFEQVAQAVGYAHRQGVIHRDLKPSNIMVGAFGEVQVMDWGSPGVATGAGCCSDCK